MWDVPRDSLANSKLDQLASRVPRFGKAQRGGQYLCWPLVETCECEVPEGWVCECCVLAASIQLDLLVSQDCVEQGRVNGTQAGLLGKNYGITVLTASVNVYVLVNLESSRMHCTRDLLPLPA